MPPKFFQIGFNKCGTTFIARLFDLNRIPAAHWLEGALADDIAYARLTGARPLARWADSVTAFTDMESVRFLNMPVIEGFREFALLDRHYPGSIFLLNTRRVEDWIASRYLHRGGAYARSIAANLGVPLGDLGDIWARDWARPPVAVRAHFAGRPTFIDIDIDQAAPEDYRRALSPWYDLPHLPALPGAGVRQARRANLPRVLAMMQTAVPSTDIDPDRRARLAARLAGWPRPPPAAEGTVDRPPHAQALCLDMDHGRLRTADGADLPLHRGPDGRFYLAAQRPGLLRAAAVANDIAALTDQGGYWLDMRPATFAGSGPDDPADGPLIASLRRTGARNVFLWPAPWLHRIGNDGFPAHPRAMIPHWQDRADVAGWRGTLSGHHDRLTAEGAITRPADQRTGRPTRSSEAVDALPRMPRWRFLADHAGRDGVDLALIPDARVARALDRAGLRPPAPQAPPRPPRHALCLAGSEGDADLLPWPTAMRCVILPG